MFKPFIPRVATVIACCFACHSATIAQTVSVLKPTKDTVKVIQQPITNPHSLKTEELATYKAVTKFGAAEKSDLQGKKITEYDETGRKTSTTFYDANGIAGTVFQFVYENGKISAEYEYRNGSRYGTAAYSHDNEGRVIFLNKQWGANQMLKETTRYDANGNAIEQEVDGTAGQFKTTFNYDDTKLLMGYTYYEYRRGQVSVKRTLEFQYDELRRRILTITRETGMDMRANAVSYDSLNNVIVDYTYDSTGKIYDKKTYEYTYDISGKWITQTRYIWTVASNFTLRNADIIIERKFAYY